MSKLYKKTTLVLAMFAVLYSAGIAQQKPLTPSRQSSYYTYIYKLEPDEVLKFYKDAYYQPEEKVFHTLIDSFRTDKTWQNHLPAGNYVEVHAEKNALQYRLIENHSAFLKLMLNNDDMPFMLIDKQDNKVNNAVVHVKNRLIGFDAKSGLYHTRLTRKDAVVRVDYNGVANFFKLKKGYGGYHRRLFSISELRRRWYLFKWFLGLRGNQNHYYGNGYNQAGVGFMIFNKPKYKPLDTVKFKAFILKKGSYAPIDQPKLLIRLVRRNDDDGTIVGWVNRYRDGGYEGSFVLSDSLKLDLDEKYTLNLEDPSSIKYKLDDYDGNDDEKFLAKRKIYYSGTFDYEDYELESVSFTGRADKKEHYPGSPLAVYLKATDENDLPVADGRVTLVLTGISNIRYEASKEFIPDTLWVHQVTLEPAGETKVVIPDSIFPKVSLRYTIDANFLNSNNERQSWSQTVQYYDERYRASAQLKADSLTVSYQETGKEIKGKAIISALDSHNDTLSKLPVVLPACIRVDPNVATYAIDADSASTQFDLKNESANISISGYRTADSLFVKVNNERHLHFWYSVFAGQKLIDAGEADELTYRRAYGDQNVITFQVNYLWGGRSESEHAVVEFQDKLLNVYVKQPLTVYPGQQVKSEIVVTDQKGKPVPGVDLTAWAITRKFSDYKPPFIPYLGKSFTYKRRKTSFSIDDRINSGQMSLNWKRWSTEMGLDSIVYYQFTHPRSVFRVEEPIHDTLTQIAPFVVKEGDVVPVHVLFIDEKPVYFSQSWQLRRYSFHVNPGRHNLRFRTEHQLIRLDSVMVGQHQKLILSVNADTSNHAATIIKMPDTLSRAEAGMIDNYMVTIVDNFKGKMALLQQNDNVIMLNKEFDRNNDGAHILAGPVSPDFATLVLPDQPWRGFEVERDYAYTFEPGMLKEKSIDSRFPFVINLNAGAQTEDYTQYALDRAEADSIWQQYLFLRSSTKWLFGNEALTDKARGRLEIEKNDIKPGLQPQVRNVILYRYDDPDFLRVYPGITTNFGQLVAGRYRVMYLLRDDSYDIKEDIRVKANGINFYRFDIVSTHPRDSISIKIIGIINSRESGYNSKDSDVQNDALKIKETFNDKYFDASSFDQNISGVVISSDDKQPVVGATIKIKGMSRGTVTDVNGRFRLVAPQSCKLIISYIGYKTKEVAAESGMQLRIVLEPSSSQLNEVVVTGYTTVRRRELTGAVVNYTNGLMAKAPGLIVQGAPGAGSVVSIRGMSTFGTAKPLIIVDGVPVSDLNGIDPSDIGDISLLKDAAATALYGSAAANGVVIITTKHKVSGNGMADSIVQRGSEATLRKNFSDYAYWQPKLVTDVNGKASFTVTYPDDITNWQTFVAAINGQKQTGFSQKEVKSFKPVSANFVSPQFAVKGDQLNVIGKVLNYTTDTAKVSRSFIYNNKLIMTDALSVKNSHIDTMSITAEGVDSLTFEYSIKRGADYFDGEQRKIPLVEQGTKETKGIFEALEKDTTVSLHFDPAMGPVTFRAEASVLPTLLAETEKLRTYQYLCNEQLASKLIGLLAEKRINASLKEPFKWDKNIEQLIKKLLENRRADGTWGWWKNTDEEPWINLHVIEAFIEAKQQGFYVELDGQKLVDFLVLQLESYNGTNKLTCLETLKKLNVKVDYQKYCDSLSKHIERLKDVSKYDKFRLILLKQQVGIPVLLDSVLNTMHHTMFGNVYWGEESYRFFDNSIQLSVLVYKILKNEGKHPELLQKIRGYFLEQRRTGDWRNTYETSLILETILPDVLNEGAAVKPAAIALSGAKNETVTRFPYSTTFNANDLNLSKSGTLPVYITGYQQFWNKNPQKVSKDFTVDSWFEKKGDKITKLKGGEAVELKVEVKVKGDADYVMINIPIPAGCSYESKDQYWQNEVHREYFKDRVSIFSRKLKQGTYVFTVKLMPRYGGTYHLNPAKAEMIYFPIFYGREGMKKVAVE